MEYQTNKECSLMHVGELLDSKGYGIALPISQLIIERFPSMMILILLIFFEDSPYRKAFSEQILKLSESGILNQLKDNWWKSNISENGSDFFFLQKFISTFIACDDDKPHDDLGIGNVGKMSCIS